jgi:hypothetical protein
MQSAPHSARAASPAFTGLLASMVMGCRRQPAMEDAAMKKRGTDKDAQAADRGSGEGRIKRPLPSCLPVAGFRRSAGACGAFTGNQSARIWPFLRLVI